jgi:hypothetical protein
MEELRYDESRGRHENGEQCAKDQIEPKEGISFGLGQVRLSQSYCCKAEILKHIGKAMNCRGHAEYPVVEGRYQSGKSHRAGNSYHQSKNLCPEDRSARSRRSRYRCV